MKLVAIAALMSATIAVAQPARAPTAGSSALADSRIIYLNKSGVTARRGSVNDSRIDQSTIPPADTTIPPWTASAALWNDTVACVRDMFARFDVQVVDADPGNMPHMEAVFGGSPQLFGLNLATISVSPFRSDCSVIENSMVFVFTDAIRQDAQFACELASQALGHSYGLDRELLATDTMSTLPTNGPRTFQDQTAACGDSQARPCGPGGSGCRPDQNSFAVLTERIGSSDATPPQVTITSPGNGEDVRPGFNVVVTATDNIQVRSVTVAIDDLSIGMLTSPPYEFTAPLTLADGQHVVTAVASDGKNQSDDVMSVTLRTDTSTTPPHDGGCAAMPGGRFGLALAVVVVGLRTSRRIRRRSAARADLR